VNKGAFAVWVRTRQSVKGVKGEEVCPEEVCPEEVCPEEVCPEEVCPEEVCPDIYVW